MSKKFEHAVVIGGSVAGLLAARVLSDHFNRVTLVERDRFPLQPEGRAGVPQSVHVHILLSRGRHLFSTLFPDLDAALEKAGAKLTDFLSDYRFVIGAGAFPTGNSEVPLRMVSRVLLEHEMRQRILALANVSIRDNTNVTGFIASADRSRLQGVMIGAGRQGQGAEESLPADLVVDASGRGSRAPDWLAAFGYQAPPITRIDSGLTYATRWYEDVALPSGKNLFIGTRAPSLPRGGTLVTVDGGRFICLLAGYATHAPLAAEDKYLTFARSLGEPDVYEAIKDARPISPVHIFKGTANQWRQYHRTRLPDAFIPVGDALCAFNPFYGQGMTVSAIEAIYIGNALAAATTLQGLSARVLKRISKVVSGAWMMASSEDYRWPLTKGPPVTGVTRMTHAYMDQVNELAVRDFAVAKTFAQVLHMLIPITAMFRPKIFFGVLWRILRGQKATQHAGPFPEPPSDLFAAS